MGSVLCSQVNEPTAARLLQPQFCERADALSRVGTPARSGQRVERASPRRAPLFGAVGPGGAAASPTPGVAGGRRQRSQPLDPSIALPLAPRGLPLARQSAPGPAWQPSEPALPPDRRQSAPRHGPPARAWAASSGASAADGAAGPPVPDPETARGPSGSARPPDARPPNTNGARGSGAAAIDGAGAPGAAARAAAGSELGSAAEGPVQAEAQEAPQARAPYPTLGASAVQRDLERLGVEEQAPPGGGRERPARAHPASNPSGGSGSSSGSGSDEASQDAPTALEASGAGPADSTVLPGGALGGRASVPATNGLVVSASNGTPRGGACRPSVTPAAAPWERAPAAVGEAVGVPLGAHLGPFGSPGRDPRLAGQPARDHPGPAPQAPALRAPAPAPAPPPWPRAHPVETPFQYPTTAQHVQAEPGVRPARPPAAPGAQGLGTLGARPAGLNSTLVAGPGPGTAAVGLPQAARPPVPPPARQPEAHSRRHAAAEREGWASLAAADASGGAPTVHHDNPALGTGRAWVDADGRPLVRAFRRPRPHQVAPFSLPHCALGRGRKEDCRHREQHLYACAGLSGVKTRCNQGDLIGCQCWCTTTCVA